MSYRLKKKRAAAIMFFTPTAVSLPALGLIVVLLMNNIYSFDDCIWRNVFGGGITGHEKRIIRELISKGVLEEVE